MIRRLTPDWELGLSEANSRGGRAVVTRQKRPWWRTAGAAIGVAAVAGVLAVILTYRARSPEPGAAGGRGGMSGSGPGGRPQVTVGVATATLGSVPIQVSALGTVTPLATINVNARVSGMLDKVAFREGQMVRKGQLLAVIDPRPFQVVAQQARGQLLHDQALLQNARLDLTRYHALLAEDSVSGQTYDTQRDLVQQDEATVSADQAALAAARLNLSFTQIRSPVAGRVGLRQIDPGNQITANETTPVTVVTQIDPITVVFSLPEVDIAEVTRTVGGAGLPVTALDQAGGVVLARGSLATLDNQIDTTTGTVKARAMFPNGNGALFPNQFVNVLLLVETLQNQIIVPTTATRHGPNGDFVWVLRADRTVKSRPVTVGPGTSETVSIRSGLNAGESVITDGGDRLREGAQVVLPRSGGAPDDSGGAAPTAHGGRRHRAAGDALTAPARAPAAA